VCHFDFKDQVKRDCYDPCWATFLRGRIDQTNQQCAQLEESRFVVLSRPIFTTTRLIFVVKYDASRLIAFPGFNAEIPSDIVDVSNPWNKAGRFFGMVLLPS